MIKKYILQLSVHDGSEYNHNKIESDDLIEALSQLVLLIATIQIKEIDKIIDDTKKLNGYDDIPF